MVFTDAERRIAASTLEEAMYRAEVSASGLAARAGVSRALVRDYLRGAKQPSVAQLARLVRSLGLEPVVDLVPAYRAMTLRGLGDHLVDDVDETRRWRLLQEFLRGYGEEGGAAQETLIAERPPLVDPRWDALLGGVAEHLAFHGRMPVPAWALTPDRFLDRWWFPGAVDAEGRTWRMMSAPAALAARGVWLDRAALARAA